MRSILINMIILFGFSVIFAESCEGKKKLYEQKLDVWKGVETEMKSGEITKAKYDALLPKYNSLWEESEKLKKDYLKCKDETENQHKAAYNQGIQFKKDRKFKEALAKFEEAIKIKKDFEEAYQQAADVCAEISLFFSNFFIV